MYHPTSDGDKQPTVDNSEELSRPRFRKVQGEHGPIIVDMEQVRYAMRRAMEIQEEKRKNN